MAPLILTLVRHGESLDNLKNTWAGHLDATLSVHGHAQALRLGAHFKDVPINAIYTSDLKRARITAESVKNQNVAGVNKFVVDEILREQWFGAAEGSAWDSGTYASAGVDWEGKRSFRLAPDAECLDDIAIRADSAIQSFILPHVLSSHEAESEHVCLFAHGIFLSEFLYALQRSAHPKLPFKKSTGYTNTGWSRVELELMPGSTTQFSAKMLAFNQTEHLDSLVRQKGGIGNSGFDPNQKTIKDFFSGA